MSNQSIADYLNGHAFFDGLDAEYIDFLVQSTTEIELEQDKLLFRQGDKSNHFYLLRSGRVSIQIPALVGPTLEIQSLGENQILGWSWLIPPYRWSFQARVVEDSVLLEFDGDAILAHCEKDPKFGYELFKRFATLMSERLDAARQKMMDEWNPPGFA